MSRGATTRPGGSPYRTWSREDDDAHQREDLNEFRRSAFQGQLAEVHLLVVVGACVVVFVAALAAEIVALDALVGWDRIAGLRGPRALGELLVPALTLGPGLIASWLFRRIAPRRSSWG